MFSRQYLLLYYKRHEINLTICNWIIIAINTNHASKLLKIKKISSLKMYKWWPYFVDNHSQSRSYLRPRPSILTECPEPQRNVPLPPKSGSTLALNHRVHIRLVLKAWIFYGSAIVLFQADSGCHCSVS
jgi:hypothetical protein